MICWTFSAVWPIAMYTSGSSPSSRGSCHGLGATLGSRLGAGRRRREQRVLDVVAAVARAVSEAADRLDAGRDVDVALPRLDRVERHARGLQRRRAVAGDRRAGQVVVAEQHGHVPAHVPARLAAGKAATEHQVGDVLGVELRHLVQRGAHHLDGEVVGTHVLERALERPADRRARSRDDDSFGHLRTPALGR